MKAITKTSLLKDYLKAGKFGEKLSMAYSLGGANDLINYVSNFYYLPKLFKDELN